MMPLHKACQYGQLRCVEELLKYGGESQILEQNAVIFIFLSDIRALTLQFAVRFHMFALGCERICAQ